MMDSWCTNTSCVCRLCVIQANKPKLFLKGDGNAEVTVKRSLSYLLPELGELAYRVFQV